MWFVRNLNVCITCSDKISLCLDECVRWSASVLRCGALWWPHKLDTAAQMTLNMAEACHQQLDAQKHEVSVTSSRSV